MQTLSESIRDCRQGVINNPYQGGDKKVLFVCSMGILRSATGARLYAHKYNTRSAGTYPDALIQVSPVLMAWANEIVVVNKTNYMHLLKRFGEEEMPEDKIKVLDIPDSFPHMHDELVQAFIEQYEPV